MKKTDWQKIIKTSADPARVKDFLNSAKEIGAGSQLEKFSTDSARILAPLVSGSQYLGEVYRQTQVSFPYLILKNFNVHAVRRVFGVMLKSF